MRGGTERENEGNQKEWERKENERGEIERTRNSK